MEKAVRRSCFSLRNYFQAANRKSKGILRFFSLRSMREYYLQSKITERDIFEQKQEEKLSKKLEQIEKR